MTNPIPPCPVCGEQPTEKMCKDAPNEVLGVYHHRCTFSQMFTLANWQEHCSNYLGRALYERGIHTLAEMDKRLTQVGDDVKLAFAGLTDLIAARDYLETLIRAQRGEVEG